MSGINIGNLQTEDDVQIGEINIPLITPKRGIDYWTPSDKQEVVDEAVDAVNAVVMPQEQERQSNEVTRQNNETTRQSNETTRQENEATRIENETAREARFVEIETLVDNLEDDVEEVQTEQEKLKTLDSRYTEPYDIDDIDVNLSSMGASDFYDLWDSLQEAHPNKITSQVWGTDDFGNQLKYYIIEANSKKDCGINSSEEYYVENLENNLHSAPYMFFTSGLHGNEKHSVYELYLAFKDYFEGKKDSDNFILDNYNYIVLPCCNPSGLNNNTRNNSNGVNINRNFPIGDLWEQQADTDKGQEAGDQKETQFIMDVLSQYSSQKFKTGMVCIDWHSHHYYLHADKRVLWFTINNYKFKQYMLKQAEFLKNIILEKYPDLATDKTNPNEHFIHFVTGVTQCNTELYCHKNGYYSATAEVPDSFTQGIPYTEMSHRIAYMIISNTILRITEFCGNMPEIRYNQLAQIGCSTENTLIEVINALPNNSSLQIVLSSESRLFQDMPVVENTAHGMLTIEKAPRFESSVACLTYRTYGFIKPRIWIASYNNNNNFYGWRELADYTKPVGGIPKTDLASDVQASLDKADSAIQEHQDITGKEDKLNKVTSISSESTDTQYPSAKCVYDIVSDIQEEQTTQNEDIEELQSQVETLQEDLDNAETEIDTLQQDVEDLRNASYKIPGTGTDITLNNTAKGRLLKNELSGRTEQEQLSGKNLFDIGTQKSDYSNQTIINNFIENGVKLNVVDYGNTVSYRLQNLEGNKQYAITATSSVVKGRFYVRIRSLDDSRWLNNDDINLQAYGWTYISGYNGWYLTFNSIAMSKVITIPECLYWQLGLGYESASSIVGTIQSISNIQVEQGTTATSYEPYCGGIPSPNPQFPQPIKNVTGQANVKIQNRNLFNLTAQDFKNGTIVGYASKVFLGGLKPNTIYICSTNDTAQLGSSTTNLLFGGANSTANGVNISSPKTAISNENGEIEVLLRTTNIDNFLNNYWVQIEEGTTATSYVPHQEQNYPFTFAEGQRGMQGTEFKDDGRHNIRSHYIITGNENWSYYGFTSESLYFAGVTRLNNIKYYGVNSPMLCNRLSANNGAIYNKTGEAIGCLQDGYLYICLLKEKIGATLESTNIECVELLKQYLATQYQNNMPYEIEYTLIEEEIIPYNETQQAEYNAMKQARSYDDQTNFSSTSTELGFNMNVESLANANKVIDSLDTRLLALESEV